MQSTDVLAAPSVGFKPTLGKDIHLSTTVSAGKSKKIDYTLVNLTDAKLAVSAVLDVAYAGEIGAATELNSARSFITVPNLPIIVDPSARQYLPITITVPANTAPGQYQAVITVTDDNETTPLAQSKVSITVDGELTKQLAATLASSINGDKMQLVFDLENKGNTTIDNVLAKVSIFNKKLGFLFKLPKEVMMPLNVGLSVGEKVTLTKILEIPLDSWADYEIKTTLDYGANQPLMLSGQLSYQRQGVITAVLAGMGLATIVCFILLLLVIRSFKSRHKVAQTYSTPTPENGASATSIPITYGLNGLTSDQLQLLLTELKQEMRTIIKEELQSQHHPPHHTVLIKKLARHDLMDSFQRYLSS